MIEVLKEKGIRQVVLSPGSRNAPLLVAFAREKQIRHFVVLDERSAAFMALGIGYPSPCKRHDHPEIARRGLTVKKISGSWHSA